MICLPCHHLAPISHANLVRPLETGPRFVEHAAHVAQPAVFRGRVAFHAPHGSLFIGHRIGKVGFRDVGVDAELRRAAHRLPDLRRPHQGFGRYAARPETLAAQFALFGERHFAAHFGGGTRGFQPCRTASDHNQVKLLHEGSFQLLF